MDTFDKLGILSADSRYDLACACGTNDQDRRRRGANGQWLYPVTLPDGGRSVLLKTLLSNACENDCKYCPLRSDTNIRRCALTPDETARVFMRYLECWAERHPDFYPVRINQADREALLRVPGLGLQTVARLLDRRRHARLTTLEGLGVRGKRHQKTLAYVRFD